MQRIKALFHIVRVPVVYNSHQTCFGVYLKEVMTNEELVRSSDKGKLMGKYKDLYDARNRIQELAKTYGEFAIFE